MKGYLFDLDGVIANTTEYHFTAWQHLIKRHFDQSLPASFEKNLKGVSREDSLKKILQYLDISISDEQFNDLAEEKNCMYIKLLGQLNSNDILPGVYQLFSDIKSHGEQIALASASRNAPFILDKLDILDMFDAIADPAKVKSGKPAPDIFLAAAHAINVSPEECIGFEDSVAGIEAINRAGAYSIGVGGPELSHANKIVPSTIDLHYIEIRNL